MTTIEDINPVLAALYRIHGMSAPDTAIEQLLKEGRLDDANEMLSERVLAIRDISSAIGGKQEGANLFVELEGRLTSAEYILPPEIEEIHHKVLRDITSGRTIDTFEYGGLLLFGETAGTGKTEYAKFLAHQAGEEKVRFVTAILSTIRTNQNPGLVLRNLYHLLESKAKHEGVMYVLLFDEFDKLVSQYATHHSRISEDNYDYRDSKGRKTSTEHRETAKTLEVDAVGEELFATLKTIISGTEEIRHVYTIATSNRDEYPPALLRRLRPVEIFAIGIPEFRFKDTYVPDYGGYFTRLPRIIAILQSAYARQNSGGNSSALSQIAQEITQVHEPIASTYVIPEDPWDRKLKIAERNNAYLMRILQYFGYDLEESYNLINPKFSYGTQKVFKFAGLFHEPLPKDQDRLLQRDSFNQSTSPEVLLMRNLTPDTVVKWYKANPMAFEDYESAKKFLGQTLFPQLKSFEDFKAKQLME